MKWLENMSKMCLFFTTYRQASLVDTSDFDLETGLFF